MKQLNTYINEALIKKDTKLDISEYLIFIPWNCDFTNFNRSEYRDELDLIKVNTGDIIWIIRNDEIEKIKSYITDDKTKLYYIPAKYSKDKFIEDCKKFEITMEDIQNFEEYEI